MESGSALFDTSAVDFPMTLTDATVVCGTGVNGPTKTPTPTYTPSPTATATKTPVVPHSAVFSAVGGGTRAVNESFTVEVDLTDVTFDSGYPNWGGYGVVLDFDPTVLTVIGGSAPTDLCPNVYPPPPFFIDTGEVTTGCAFQASTVTAGPLLRVTFACLRGGVSVLHLPARASNPFGNDLFNEQALDFNMTLTDSSVSCDGALPTATSTSTPTPTATSTPANTPTATAGPPDSATIAMRAPAQSQPLDLRFGVTADLTAFVPGTMPYWGGYSFELAYDPTVVAVDYVAPGLCTLWVNPQRSPEVRTGCVAQDQTSTGRLENIVFHCLQDGTTTLHIVTAPNGLGTVLFDTTGAAHFTLTLQDATVTCDQHVDDDHDRCSNTKETALGLDASDPWDFYSVPVPALLSAPDPHLDLSDSVVSASDAQAVFAYFKAGAKIGTQVYDQDLDGDGVQDGVQYDRSMTGPAKTGAPDGAVTARDAQLAEAQFKLGYNCK